MKRIKVSESIKNITKISTGTVLGQAISIISLPFITRIYGAEVIGIWTIINSFSGIMSTYCELGLTNTLMVCEQALVGKQYGSISLISVVLSALSSCCVFSYYLCIGDTVSYACIICLFCGAYAVLLVQNNLCATILNRDKKYTVLMSNSVIRFGTIAVVAVFLGLIGFTKYGYYIASISGMMISVLHMRRNMSEYKASCDLQSAMNVIRENIQFVKFQMPANMTVSLRTELPNLLIGALFSEEILGCFSVSQKLLTIPVTFLGQSIGKVFYQHIAEMKRAGEKIGGFVQRNVNRGMIIALIPMTILAAFGDILIVFFFGKGYYIGGVICRIIVFRALFNFISTTIGGIDIVLNKQHYILITCLLQTILASISILAGYYIFDSIYVAVGLLTISFILVQVVYFCELYKVMGLSIFTYLRNIALILVMMAIGASVLRYVTVLLLGVIGTKWSVSILELFNL